MSSICDTQSTTHCKEQQCTFKHFNFPLTLNQCFSVEHLNRAEDDIQQAILLLQKLQPASAQHSINPPLPKNDPNDVDALRRLILKKKQIELSKQVNAYGPLNGGPLNIELKQTFIVFLGRGCSGKTE